MTKFLHFNNERFLSDFARHNPRSKQYQKKYQSRTIAVDPPTPLEVKMLAAKYVDDQSLSVNLRVGLAVVNLLDQYNKKIGRTVALEKMKDRTFDVTGTTTTPTHVFVHLSPIVGIQLNLRVNKSTGYTTVTSQVVDRVPGSEA